MQSMVTNQPIMGIAPNKIIGRNMTFIVYTHL